MTILAEEALSRIPAVKDHDIVTPTDGIFKGLAEPSRPKICVVSIIRSGDILQEAFRKLEPGIKVGKILLQRDEESTDKKPIFYYKKLPKDISNCFVLLVDPMLATAGSCLAALKCLVETGVDPDNIMFVNLISCQYGIDEVHRKYPNITILTMDKEGSLNDQKYIVPGLGDFGDRYYGTE